MKKTCENDADDEGQGNRRQVWWINAQRSAYYEFGEKLAGDIGIPQRISNDEAGDDEKYLDP